MGNFKIGELAAAAGVGRDTIRYYERMGLLREPARTAAGYRLYDATDLERVNFIRSAQELGFTLEQARQLLALRASDTAHAQAVLDITLAKIADADECPGEVPVSDCPILAFLTARRKDQQHNKKHQAAQDERSPRAKGVLS